MAIDTFATAALADELTEKLQGGKVQDSVELDRETFGFEIYANRERQYLLLSANNQHPRALIAPDKLRRGVQKPSTLGLMIRTRIEGMRLQSITQPPYERLLIFEFGREDETLQLIIEIMPRRANLILVEGNMILDCARRIGPQDNRYRIILPKHEYVPPPPLEGKLDPAVVTPHSIEGLLRQHEGEKAWSALIKGILGFSPLLAKEVVYRAYQDIGIKAKAANPYTLHAAYESFVHRLIRHDWQPGYIFDQYEFPKTAVAFEVTHEPWQAAENMSDALNQVYGELRGEAAYDAARKPIMAQLTDAKDRVERKLRALERESTDESEIEELRIAGELLLAYQYDIVEGQEILEAQYDPDGEPLKIKINTDLTPLENAQRYFERYEKKKRAFGQIPQRIAATRDELEWLEQLEGDLLLASNWNDIGEVQALLQENGYWQGKKYAQPKGGKSAPLKVTTDIGFIIFVGRNSRQNAQLLDRAEPYDLWLHARDVPGAHVIIKSNAKPVPPEVLLEAASYAAYYSKLRNEDKVLVQVAEARYVRKRKGGQLGQVTIHQEREGVVVEPAPVEDGE